MAIRIDVRRVLDLLFVLAESDDSAEHYSGPIATGENMFSLQDARNLIRYGGLRPDRDFIQVDPAL